MKYLLSIATTIFVMTSALTYAQEVNSNQLQEKLGQLEKNLGGKIGVYAIDTSTHQIIAYHSEDRFPIQSTFKLIGVSALLKQSKNDKEFLNQKIHYTTKDLIFWHPITGQHVATGMTLEALSAAAISYSDNTAANLITKKLGGPKAITDFAHAIGNLSFNVEHYECNLNSNPNVAQDTSTPKDMALSLQKLTLGNVLTHAQRDKLLTWMKDNTAGYRRMRAGAPTGWVVMDKTGSGDYGIANDIGILQSPVCKPIVLAIYTVRNKQDAKSSEEIVPAITKMVMDEFAKTNSCFNALNS